MSIEKLEVQQAQTIAAAKEQIMLGGDMTEANRLHASAKSIGERIAMLKDLGSVPAPVEEIKAITHEDHYRHGGTGLAYKVFGVDGVSRDQANAKAYAFGQWVRGAVLRDAGAAKWCNNNNIKIQTEGTTTAGGFTVPDILSSDLIWLRNQYGIARKYSRIYPMTSDTLLVPNASTSTTAYYPGEATAITASDIAFTQLSLVAKKLAVLTLVSRELSEDTVIDFGAALARDMAYVIAQSEDAAAFNGDGSGTYGGLNGIMPTIKALSGTFANIAAMQVGAATSSASLNNFTLANWSAMVGRLAPYATNPRWYMHKNVWINGVADKLIALSGNDFLSIQNATSVEPMFFGIPVTFVQNMTSATGVSVDVAVLGDLSLGVAFGDRRGITIEVSDQVKFIEDCLTFKATSRYGFVPFDTGNVTATVANQVAGALIVLQAST